MVELKKAIRDLAVLAIGVLVVDVIFDSHLHNVHMREVSNGHSFSFFKQRSQQSYILRDRIVTSIGYINPRPNRGFGFYNCSYNDTVGTIWGRPNQTRFNNLFWDHILNIG